MISYNLYWLVVIIGFLLLGFKERTGRWPLQKPTVAADEIQSDSSSSHVQSSEKKDAGVVSSAVREIQE